MARLTYEVAFGGVASPTLRAAFADHDLDERRGRTVVVCRHDALTRVVALIEEFGLELLDIQLVAEHDVDQEVDVAPPGPSRSPRRG